ncbi:hypothetical protein ACV3NQ_04110 [Clostridium perfringens]|nr:hypothetical protein [Clostridium perfringens]
MGITNNILSVITYSVLRISSNTMLTTLLVVVQYAIYFNKAT